MLPPGDPARGYSVGQVAGLLGVQQAFLRRLEAHDLVRPPRSEGMQRRYRPADVEQVQQVVGLIGEGLTLTGVRRVLELQERVRALESELAELRAATGRRAPGRRGPRGS